MDSVNDIVSTKVRFLAVFTASAVGVAGGAGLGLLFPLFVPSFLFVGALIQPRFRQLGRGLMRGGAIWLSGFVFLVVFFGISEGNLSSGNHVALAVLFALAILVAACDVMIFCGEARLRRWFGAEKGVLRGEF